MGSFYTMCSVTNQTICDDQEMYVQFMVPSYNSKYNVADGLTPKGMIVSESSSFTNWVPFGPAIRGHYNDYGNIKLSDDNETKLRVNIIETIMGGIPFDSIMSVATKTLYSNFDKKFSDVNGITEDTPQWLLTLCEKISITYIHAAVYDEMVKFDFIGDEKDGIMVCEYSIKYANERIDYLKTELPKILESIKNPNISQDYDTYKHQLVKMEICDQLGIFRNLSSIIKRIYLARLSELDNINWFYETDIFMSSLSSLNISLNQSNYGGQSQNWYGWKRLYRAIEPVIESGIERFYDYE
jgi:hypothetical protein